ncbi:MAG: hypothetical protein JWQ50_4719 [Caballeronia mineralivorans]|nr:hypothetical protein [Caballeronia mineralivorans]
MARATTVALEDDGRQPSRLWLTVLPRRISTALHERDSTNAEVTIPGLIQSVATGLLRHYPLDVDLDVSASVLPGTWAHPKCR